MFEKLDSKEIARLDKLLMTILETQHALINLLEAKGIIKKTELLQEIKRLRDRKGKG